MNDRNTETRPTHSTHTVVETRGGGGGSSAIWLILGGVLAAVLIFWLLGVNPAAMFGGTETGGDSVTVNVGGDAAEAVEGAADAVGAAAESVGD